MNCCLRFYINFFRTKLLTVFVLIGNSLVSACQQPMIHIETANGKITRSIEQKRIAPGKAEAERNVDNFYLPQNINSSGSQKTFTVAGPITLTITTTGSTCMSYSGSVIAFASGGTPPYKYSLSGSFIQNNGIFPKLRGGTYTLDVTDALGQTASVPVIVGNTYDPPTLTVGSFIYASDCSAKDASITLSASGGVPPYQYTKDQINYQISNTFTGLYPGEYDFFVKDANGCMARFNTFNTSHFRKSSCNGLSIGHSGAACTNTGIIDLESFGSDPPYQYSIDGVNYQASGDFFNLLPGLYPAHFKDSKGNIEIFMVTILRDCGLAINFITVDAACGQNDGALTANVVQGSPPYTYSLDGINFQSSNTFTGLAPGYYVVMVKDIAGGVNTALATVYDRCPQVTATATDANCPANNDGTITATGTKGTAPYEYSLDGVNFQSSNIFTGLPAGKYTVTVKDAQGFTSPFQITVGYSCLNVSAASVNSTCGNSNGSITVTAGNGTAPYQYSLDGINFQFSNQFFGLLAGPYTIKVKDASGQTGNATATVQDIPGATVSAVTGIASCAGNDGSITATGTGGTTPYQFSIDGINYQSANVFSNLVPGPYKVWIKDAASCPGSQNVTVGTSCPTATTSIINETCGKKNGSITATGANGTAPYQFSIDGINFLTSNLFSNLSAGNYTITIKDAAGVTNTAKATVANICPVVTAKATDGLCGTAKGLITATGTNGTAPYQYSLDGVNFQTANTFANLTSSTYTITVKDVNGLTNETTATVKNFPGPVLSESISSATCINNNGKIVLSSTAGTVPLTYSIDGTNFIANNNFNSLRSGNYTVYVKDANGCPDNKAVNIPMTNDLTLNTGNDMTICEGEKVKLPATSNGASFKWTQAGTLNDAGILNPVASPVITTKYNVTATLGVCTIIGSVNVNVNPAPVANAGEAFTICYGKDTMLKGSGGIIYQWSPATYLDNPKAQSPKVIKPKSSITYNLVVKDNKGCTSLNNALVKVNVTPPAKIFAGNDTAIILNQPFQLEAADINNSGFVTYKWSPPVGLNKDNIENPVATLDREMKYTVMAATAAGCEGSDEIIIKVYKGPEIYVPSAFTPDNDGLNDILKAVPVGIKDFKYFKVFNRWGQVVFSTKDPSRGWDGKFNNAIQDGNSFVWIAEGTDVNGKRIQRKGSVTIVR
jgi:gliding motility-associated-like protein